MAVVNTNIGASVAQAALMRNERALNTAMEHCLQVRRSTPLETTHLD